MSSTPFAALDRWQLVATSFAAATCSRTARHSSDFLLLLHSRRHGSFQQRAIDCPEGGKVVWLDLRDSMSNRALMTWSWTILRELRISVCARLARARGKGKILLMLCWWRLLVCSFPYLHSLLHRLARYRCLFSNLPEHCKQLHTQGRQRTAFVSQKDGAALLLRFKQVFQLCDELVHAALSALTQS